MRTRKNVSRPAVGRPLLRGAYGIMAFWILLTTAAVLGATSGSTAGFVVLGVAALLVALLVLGRALLRWRRVRRRAAEQRIPVDE